MVLETQKWLNTTYKNRYGYKAVPEDGHTGWPTIYSLTRALQLELGISEPADNFGPTTAKLFGELSINSNPNESDKSPKALNTRRKIKILQGSLWCKGYNPGGFTGFFGANTEKAIRSLQEDAGLPRVNGVVDATVMKALLSMDAFTLLNYGSYNGDAKIREIQQTLNRKYSNNSFFKEDLGLVPCDGIYERKTNKALIYALQIEEGISEPTGYFGPGTRANCPYLTLGTENQFVTLLQYALYCNGKDFNPTGFTGYYGNGTRGAVLRFQQFTGLSNSGNAGMQTWSSLLTSVGDPTRQGTACDCSTTITKEKAQTIVNSGYKIVGRYLTGRFKLTAQEFKTIIDAGLSLIPIFEVNGYEASWFNATNGAADAISALNAASELGIPNNAIIYFAVDYDVSGYELENKITPYFKAIKDIFTKNNNPYKIGIYAPRQVCSTMSQKGYTCSSFVCDMSTGFACNLGYSLPDDWAFDQISTISIGSGNGFIEIDNNIVRGTDNGCNHISDTTSLKTERIVISGSEYDAVIDIEVIDVKLRKRYKYNFIEPVINELRAFKNNYPSDKITWLISSTDYTDTDITNFKDTANKLGVNIRFFKSSSELIEYINSGRSNCKIGNITIFSHGLVGSVELGYNQSNSADLRLDIINIKNINPASFTKDSLTSLYSCNSATKIDYTTPGLGAFAKYNGKSFISEWYAYGLGQVQGYNGKTDYALLFGDTDESENQHVKDRSYKGYVENGAIMYPKPTTPGVVLIKFPN